MPEGHGARMVDVSELGSLIHRRRSAQKLTLREVEEELNHAITASSLSRIERGAVPDSRNVPMLAKWLKLPIEMVAWPKQANHPVREVDTPTAIEVHLRADRNLDPAAAEALAAMFRQLYGSVSSGKLALPPKDPKKKR